MKKSYNAPKCQLVELEDSDLVTSSPDSIDQGGNGDGRAMEGKSRGRAIWDD